MTTALDSEMLETAGAGPGVEVASPAERGGAAKGWVCPFDPWRLAAAVFRRWYWVVLVAGMFAVVSAGAGYFKSTAKYRATAQLMRQDPAAPFRASEIGEPFKPRQLSMPTLVSLIKSPTVLERVSEQTQVPGRALAAGLTVTPERNTDLMTLSFLSTRSAQTAARVLNAFGNEVVRLTRELQIQEASEMNRLLKRQLAKTDSDLQHLNRELLDFSEQTGLVHVDKEIDAYLRSLGELDLRYESSRIEFETIDLRIHSLEQELAANNPLTERLQVAREKIAELLQQYTEAHPLVVEQKATVTELETRLKESEAKPAAPPRQGESGLAAGFYAELLHLRAQKQVTAAQLEKLKAVRETVSEKLRGLPEKGMQLARIKARQQSLEAAQTLLASRQREAELYEESAIAYYRWYETKVDEVEVTGRSKVVLALALAGAFLGFVFAAGIVAGVEALDGRILTTSDLRRSTGLPLLARLPRPESLDAVGQSNHAFRTWLALQAKLIPGSHRERVCGVFALSTQEGCADWITGLGRAACQREETVVVVTHTPPSHGQVVDLEEALSQPETCPRTVGQVTFLETPVDWRWTPVRRRQWRDAVELWARAGRLVVLVEVTAAGDPETVSFAEELPQVIWLSGSGVALARETSERIAMLRHAGCHLLGAVLNHEVKLWHWS